MKEIKHIRKFKEHRLCKICGKDYIIKNPRSKYCEGPHYKSCIVCGSQMDYFYRGDCCSNKCRQFKRKNTCLEKYGFISPLSNKEVKEKMKRTNLERYGVENVYQAESIKDKIKQTNLKRYGVENVSNSEEIRHKAVSTCLERNNGKYFSAESLYKRKNTCLEKYGVEHVLQSKEVQNKSRRTLLEKYGVDNPLKVIDIINKVKTTCLERYGVEYFCLSDKYINNCGKIISKLNKKFASKLKNDYNLDTEFEYVLDKKKFDLHIIGTDILIEINPTITHNSTQEVSFGKGRKGKPKDCKYHYNKSILAMVNNFRCIHIWDWDNVDEVIDKYILHYSKKVSGIVDLSKEDLRLYDLSNIEEDVHEVELNHNLVQVYGVGLLKL